jgi:hypothetical protein
VLHIWEVPDSNYGLEIGDPERLLWFSFLSKEDWDRISTQATTSLLAYFPYLKKKNKNRLMI